MKYALFSILIGIATSFAGCIFASFIAAVFFNANDPATGFLAGLAIYLCIIVVFCTRLILKKMNKG